MISGFEAGIYHQQQRTQEDEGMCVSVQVEWLRSTLARRKKFIHPAVYSPRIYTEKCDNEHSPPLPTERV